MNRRSKPGGFTLVELMVVIVLIGIASAMILPEMKGSFEDARLRAAAREMVGVLNLAYSRSVSQNQVHRLRLGDSGEYEVERAVREGQQTYFRPLRGVPGLQGKIDSRVTVSIAKNSPEDESRPTQPQSGIERAPFSERSVLFYPDGTAESAEVRFKDRTGFQLRLEISPITSRVRVIEVGRQ